MSFVRVLDTGPYSFEWLEEGGALGRAREGGTARPDSAILELGG